MIVNGRQEEQDSPQSVADLIAARGLRPDRVAVEVNGEVVPRAAHAQTMLKGTDTVEVVTFVQGG